MTTIRTATPDDAALLARLNDLVHGLHVEHRPDLFVWSPNQDSHFRERIGDPAVTVFIAEGPDGTPVGYAIARIVHWPGNTFTTPDVVVSLDQLAVSPEAARTGVGSALLDAVREAGRTAGCRRLVTTVWDFNEPARALYQATGFRPMNHQLDQLL
ncbi:GNAT family N-acetyltransferase [Kitasatospora aureofaciens]|uniref:GNAT family N-acetyltransferase n=1 Tax=Kitasatospora aureofaciens TaxID=1894 RepID=UPI001C456CE1|nr:GNAT family N-acetyltransferase [Kitasatospora aureofaciens]MBV6698020.1 GNAT family N-acetyltransferase [Kitasatospora aureofaciens]